MEDMINVGTAERPAWIPVCALEDNTLAGEDFWVNVACGTVDIGPEEIGRLLEMVANQDEGQD